MIYRLPHPLFSLFLCVWTFYTSLFSFLVIGMDKSESRLYSAVMGLAVIFVLFLFYVHNRRERKRRIGIVFKEYKAPYKEQDLL